MIVQPKVGKNQLNKFVKSLEDEGVKHIYADPKSITDKKSKLKTVYTGDVDSFKKVVESIPVPVVIAGGPKAKTDLDILQMTEDAMAAGAKGVTYGRNIFAHKSPDKMVQALAGIIFRKETAKEMAKKIGAW